MLRSVRFLAACLMMLLCLSVSVGALAADDIGQSSPDTTETGKAACEHNEKRYDDYLECDEYTDVWGLKHSGTGKQYSYCICDGCGELLSWKLLSENYTGTTHHYFVDGVCDCGYEKQCEHENFQMYFRLLDGEFTSILADSHRIKGWAQHGQYCTDCGELLSAPGPLFEETSEDGYYPHTYIGGVCACGHIDNGCKHTSRKTIYEVLNPVYCESYGGTHRVSGTRVRKTACRECGEPVAETEVIDEAYTARRQHEFIDGVCGCGYVHHCDHDFIIPTRIENRVLRDNGDGTHTVTGQLYNSPVCRKCGEYEYVELVDPEYISTVPHVFYGETCDVCECGAENMLCDHDNTQAVENFYEESFADVDQLQHYEYGYVEHQVICSDCFTLLSADYGTCRISDVRRIDKHDYEYDTGRCKTCLRENLCGHPQLTERWEYDYTVSGYTPQDVNFHAYTAGERLFRECPDCGMVDYSTGRIVPAVGRHVFGEWNLDGEFYETNVCRDCGYIRPDAPVLPEAIEILAGDSLTIERTQYLELETLEVRVTPADAYYELNWNCDTGKLYGTSWTGTLTATVSTQNGCTDSIEITIVDTLKPSAIRINEADHIYLAQGYFYPVEVYLLPETAVDAYYWSFSKDGYVDSYGRYFEAVKPGTVTGTVKTRNGKKDSVKITVVPTNQPVEIYPMLSGTQILTMNDLLTLEYELYPFGTESMVTCSSSNPKVARVQADNTVVPVSEGAATITLTTANGKTASVKVQVVDPYIPAAVELQGAASLSLYESLALSANVLPQTAVTELTWSVSDDSIAEITGDGVLYPKKPGVVTVTVTTANGKSDSGKIDIYDPYIPQEIYIDFPQKSTELGLDETLILNVFLEPADARSELTWTSSDESIVTVKDGVVTPVAEGSAVITVSTYNNLTDQLVVKVIDQYRPTGVELELEGTVQLSLTDATVLLAWQQPDTARGELTWTSSNPAVATVESDGFVTPLSVGVTTITVSTYNGHTASVKINVFDPYAPEGISLNQTGTVKLSLDEVLPLFVSLQPETAKSELKWSATSSAILTVDENGVVTPLKEGTATVTVATYNGKTASVKITVFDPTKATSVAFDHEAVVEIDLFDDPMQLNAVMQPETATSALTWKSSSTKIVTVDENGVITPIKEGSATITVTTATGKKATQKIKVVDNHKPASVVLSEEGTVELSMFDEELDLDAYIMPGTAISDLTWKSSSAKIATVDADGIVTPVGEGTATITVKTRNGKSDTVKVKIVDNYKPTAVVLDEAGPITISLYDDPMQLGASLQPETAVSELTWNSSNAKIVTVDENGVITPIKEGSATITVKTRNGKSDTVKVNIVDPYKPTAVVLNQEGTVPVYLGDNLCLTADLQPETAHSNLTWTSSSTKIATVDENGVVTPIKEGTATITVKTHNGKSDTVKVTVADPKKAFSITLAQEGTVICDLDGTLPLNATMEPSTAESTVVWSTSNKKIATVDANGVVTGIKEGTVTITVKTSNGKSDSVKVTVNDPKKAVAVTLNCEGTVDMVMFDDVLQLSAEMLPVTAEGALTWKSSNTKIAAVDENGFIIPVGAGTATITVKTSNGKTDTVKVKVADPYLPKSVTLEQEGTLEVHLFDETLSLNATLSEGSRSELTWSTSSAKIATVDENGEVTPVGEGTATITVKTRNGKKDTVKVKVIDLYLPKSVTLEQEGTLEVHLFDETLTLNAELSEGARSDLTWSTSSAKIAVVDENGEVTPVGEGTATITVKTRNSKKDTVKVKVIDNYKPTAVVLDEAGTITANIGEPLPLHADIQPSAAISNLTWKSSSTKIATVDENGVVTGLKEGTVTITVTTRNGKKDTVKVQIVDPKRATAVTLDKEGTVELPLNETLPLNTSLTPVTAETTLKWSTSSSRIATVNADGLVTPVKTGTVTIKVTTANGKSDSVKITVVAAIPAG